MHYVYEEPVRGGYPDPRTVKLPGAERWGPNARGGSPRPPISYLTGFKPIGGGPDFELPASPWLRSGAGVFLAGTTAWAADAPLGSVIGPVIPPNEYIVTSDLSMNFLRAPSMRSGTLTARARLVEAGAGLALSEALVTDAGGRTLAHATSRYFFVKVKADLGDPAGIPPYVETVDDTPEPWQRPCDVEMLPPDVWLKMSGLEALRGVISGDLPTPPFSYLFGIRMTDAAEGRADGAMVASGWLNSPARTIYGGAIAYYADAMCTAAVQTTLPPGAVPAPLDLKVNFVRPGIADDREIFARATVCHRGRSLAVARCDITNADGKALAFATSSVLVVEGWPWDQPVTVADQPVAEED